MTGVFVEPQCWVQSFFELVCCACSHVNLCTLVDSIRAATVLVVPAVATSIVGEWGIAAA
jgi:hypothetical protein